jgi:uncharacterized protein YbcC (UPF0753/DUF2309 family)
MSQPLAEEVSSRPVAQQGLDAARPALVRSAARGVPERSFEEALAKARARIPPLWPLKHFVAVNPFLGLTDQRFEEACATMRRITGASMLMPRGYFRALLEQGRITSQDLEHAIRDAREMPGAPGDVASLLDELERAPTYPTTTVTVADVVDQAHGSRYMAVAVEEIAKWCAAYWDEGQAVWRMPWRSLPLYAAWRAAARFDRAPEVMGLEGFRDAVQMLPSDAVGTIEVVLDALGLTGPAVDAYLHRALFSVRGWAAYARYLGWYRELDGEEDEAVTQLLAIRLAWDHTLFALHDDEVFRAAWAASVDSMSTDAGPWRDAEWVTDSILQAASERAFQRELLAKLATASARTAPIATRPSVQATFCIDVRSEIFRRALETVLPGAQTIGFAGFFGFPIEYVPIGQPSGAAQCPVLLKPKFVVQEAVARADDEERTEILGLRMLRRRAAKAWKSFKISAVSSFVYVETAGLAFAAKLVGDASGLTRTVAHPSAEGLSAKVLARVRPELEPDTLAGRPTGFTTDQRIEAAESMLKAMSLTSGFARLVLLAGHGSTMVNNPHASGYDCGACGGNPGGANARVAAAVLNDPGVRAGLARRGVHIPSDTWFLGCLHDTTTDHITIFDRDEIPDPHASDVRRLEEALRRASAMARAERAPLLHLPPSADVDAAIYKRSRDWSQVRPEWGLAGNAAFIAARRERTRGLDLGGRVFLHDYDWRHDEGWRVLELIVTAPMVVASWINLQYFGSAVNQDAFGCGNKVLHNVVGTLGVLEGNGGDLRVGMPLQAVHDGNHLVHEPLRLSVFIEAPPEPIVSILRKHQGVRDLVEKGWLHLFALRGEPGGCLRYAGNGRWDETRA